MNDISTIQITSASENDDETNARRESSIRIYCDDDARWVLSDNQDQLPENEQTWRDRSNRIRQKGKPSCLANNGVVSYTDKTSGVTYIGKYKNSQPDPNDVQPLDRSVITICNAFFEDRITPSGKAIRPKLSLSADFLQNGKLSGKSWRTAQSLLTRTMIHEVNVYMLLPNELYSRLMTLAHPYRRNWQEWAPLFPWQWLVIDILFVAVDAVPGGSYGWNNVVKMSAEDAIDNADSYAILGKQAINIPRVDEIESTAHN